MKKILVLGLSLSMLSIWAHQDKYGKETIESLKGFGSLTLEGTHVTKKVTSYGGMKATNAHIGELHVDGSAKLMHTIIDGKAVVHGNFKAQDSQFKSVKVEGGSQIISSKIENTLKASGSLDARDLRVGPVKVEGSCDIKDSVINGSVKISGSLNAEKTEFKGAVTIKGIKTILKNCTTQSIEILKNNSGSCSLGLFGWCSFGSSSSDDEKQPVIELRNGTVVNDSIRFESGDGIVYVYDKSSIKGKVIGGTVVTK